jgi:hypothetical protein
MKSEINDSQESNNFKSWQAGITYAEKLITKNKFTQKDLDNFINGMNLAAGILNKTENLNISHDEPT